MFGRQPKKDLESLPEPSSDVSNRPRVISLCPRGYLLGRVCLQEEKRKDLLKCITELKASEHMKQAARVRMRRIHFVDEATTEVMDRLFDACAGLDGIEAIGCKFKTDLSWLAYLESLNQRLKRAAASGQDERACHQNRRSDAILAVGR